MDVHRQQPLLIKSDEHTALQSQTFHLRESDNKWPEGEALPAVLIPDDTLTIWIALIYRIRFHIDRDGEEYTLKQVYILSSENY